MEMMLGAAFITVFLAVLALGYTLRAPRAQVVERLARYTEVPTKQPVMEELNRPFSQRVLAPIWERLLRRGRGLVTQEKRAWYEKRVMLAGKPYGLEPEGFVVLKYILLCLMVLPGVIIRSWWVLLCFLILGYYLPDLFLKICINNRQEKITKSLPDVLDMLSVSVEAGLGFDAALQKVVEKGQGPLIMEFQQTLHEMRIGKPRREALKDMAARMEVEDVSTFVGAMVQADQLGVSISNVLKVQAEQVRQKRRQRAEEKAQKAPVKILIPLLFFIFPTIFLILLGPAAIQLLRMF